MKYTYSDLGRVQAGSTVVVDIHGGGVTNVLLLSMAEFVRYSADRPFRYFGGRYRGEPVRIEVPSDDHWFAVAEFGTYNARARTTVEVLPPVGAAPADDTR